MRISINVEGLAQSRGKIAELGRRLRNLRPARLRAGVVVLSSFQGHIRDQNGGTWPPTVENERGSPLYRTGALFRSLTEGAPGNVDEEVGETLRVGTNLRTPDGRFNIARLMQYGTGPIKPVRAKFLVFEVNGQKIFSKGTRGIPARPFIFIDSQTAEKVVGVFSSYLRGEFT